MKRHVWSFWIFYVTSICNKSWMKYKCTSIQCRAETANANNRCFYSNQGYLSGYYKKKGTFVDQVFWFSPVLPGDTQTGCCAFPPPPHWRFLSPPTCNRMTSAAAPHTPRLHFWREDCVLGKPVGENMTRAPPAAEIHPPGDSSSHLKRHYSCSRSEVFFLCVRSQMHQSFAMQICPR